MVVINGNTMKDRENDNEETPCSKLKVNSDYMMADNPMASETAKEVNTNNDLYDDLEPNQLVNSNGETHLCIGQVVSLNDKVPSSTASDVFGQLVSDTLIEDESFENEQKLQGEPELHQRPNSTAEDAHISSPHQTNPLSNNSFQETDSSELLHKQDERITTNGNEPSEPLQVEWSVSDDVPAAVQPEGNNDPGADEVEDEQEDYEDEEDYDEEGELEQPSTDEFDESEYNTIPNHQQNNHEEDVPTEDNPKDSSIMVIDSDEEDGGSNAVEEEEEDISDECDDDEECEEEEENMDDEHLGEDDIEDEEISSYQMSEKMHQELDAGLKNLTDKHGSRNDASQLYKENHYSLNDQTNSTNSGDPSLLSKAGPLSSKQKRKGYDISDYVPSSKTNTNSYSETCQIMGRNHSSIMKKVKFSQELDDLKRKGISISNSSSSKSNDKYSDESDDGIDFDEEGWEALQKWSQDREDNEHNSTTVKNQADNKKLPSIKPSNTDSDQLSNNCHKTLPNIASQQPSYQTKSCRVPESSDVLSSVNSASAVCNETAQDTRSKTDTAIRTLVPQLNNSKGYFEIGRCLEDDPALLLHVFSVTIIFTRGLNKVSFFNTCYFKLASFTIFKTLYYNLYILQC